MDNEEKKTELTEQEPEQKTEAAPAAEAAEAPKKQKISEWTGWKGWVRDILCSVLLAALILCFIRPSVVRQSSMENTLHEGNYLLLSRQAYRFGSVKRGDIIVFRSSLTRENGQDKQLIKRIIGLPGETISIEDGTVYIDGEALEEPYTKDGYTLSNLEPVTIPEGHVFCMGDNRQNSIDSRSPEVGCVPISNIMGKVFVRLFPFNEMGGFYKDLPY